MSLLLSVDSALIVDNRSPIITMAINTLLWLVYSYLYVASALIVDNRSPIRIMAVNTLLWLVCSYLPMDEKPLHVPLM